MKWINKPLEEIVYKLIKGNLLSCTAKTEKSEAFGWLTYGLQLLPYTLAGGGNLCPNSTYECQATCIYQAGNARFAAVNQARYDKTRLFIGDRKVFLDILNSELLKLNALSHATGKRIAIRLNMFSDIGWEGFINMSQYKYLQFYDYTKVPTRMTKFIAGKLPDNYHLTFSFSGDNWSVCESVLNAGHNVSVVFNKVPTSYKGFEVVDGDDHDLTFTQPNGTIIGLKYKRPTSNRSIKSNKFVVQL